MDQTALRHVPTSPAVRADLRVHVLRGVGRLVHFLPLQVGPTLIFSHPCSSVVSHGLDHDTYCTGEKKRKEEKQIIIIINQPRIVF